MVSAVLSGSAERNGHEEKLLTVKELAAELRMSLKSIVGLSKAGDLPCSCLFAPSLLHLDTSDHIWIHLTNSHHPCKTVWSAPLGA